MVLVVLTLDVLVLVLLLKLVLGQQEGVCTVGLKPSWVPVQRTAGLG